MENRTSSNGRKYNASDAPIVVVCVDGSEPTIWTDAIDGHMPWLAEVRESKDNRIADCVVPTFTIPTTYPSSPDAAIRAWYCR